jgi:hypothetical protein
MDRDDLWSFTTYNVSGHVIFYDSDVSRWLGLQGWYLMWVEMNPQMGPVNRQKLPTNWSVMGVR